MSRIQLIFYDEKITIGKPVNLSALKLAISQQFYLSPDDVEELIIYYINGDYRVDINTDKSYSTAMESLLSENGKVLDIFLEVSEKSKLYQKELENSKVVPVNPEPLKDSINEEREKLLREIHEK